MLCGERAVKWLDAERGCVAREPISVHQRDRSEPPNVPIVKRAAVVENELDGRVLALALRKVAGVDQERSGEPRLNHETVAAGEIEHDELRAPPGARDPRAENPLR